MSFLISFATFFSASSFDCEAAICAFFFAFSSSLLISFSSSFVAVLKAVESEKWVEEANDSGRSDASEIIPFEKSYVTFKKKKKSLIRKILSFW